MVNLRLIQFGALLFLFLVTGGCNRACKDIDCLHGGSCDKGTCNCNYAYGGQFCDSLCPAGYTGEFCTTEIRAQFIRQWSATITSSSGPAVQQQLSITAGAGISTVAVSNFDNQGFNFTGVVATGNSFSFSQNATGSYTGMVSGSGVVNGTNLLINLTKQDGTVYVANCNP
jgi:hypothetical protein